jgi:hypothetical protein
MKTAVRMVDLCMHGLPYQRQRPDGNTHHPDVYSCLPISVFWKEIFQPVEHRKASGHVAEKSKWMQAGTVRRFWTQRKVQTKSSRHPDG